MNTKRSLLFSIVSLILCVAMLAGTTFAWFTDSVTSANNIITSGNLDITLEYWNGTKWVDVEGKSDILTNKLWEPGVTEVAYLRVANKGSLALKYQLGINIVSETAGVNAEGKTFKLSDYINFGVVENANGETGKYATREDAVAAVTEAKKISAGYTKPGTLYSKGTENAVSELYLALVVYMPTEVGNEANHNGTNVPQIDLGINVVATQYTAENDSFNDQYDKDAVLPELGYATKAENETATVKTDDVTVEVPADAPAGEYAIEVTNKIESTDAEGNTTVALDITLTKDGVKVAANGSTVYTVSVDVGTYKTIGAITHNGEAVTNYNYDPFTGIISFETTSFSPFTFTYVDAPVNSAVLIASQGNAYYYSTLADAANAAKDGDTLTLLKDIDLGTERVTIKGKELTINLNEKTITSANERTIMVDLLRVNNADKRGVLTLTGNGTVKNTQNNASYGFAVYVGGSSDLIVNEGVTVESVYGKAVILAPLGLDNGAARYSTLNVNGGCITGRYAITGYGSARDTYITVNVNSGIVYGRDVAIYQPQFGDVTVNGGTVTGGGEAAIAMRSGNLTVNGGTVNGIIDILGDHHVSNKEDAYSTATFNGGNFDNATIKYSVGNGNVIFKADDVEAIAPDGYKWDANGIIVKAVAEQ